MKKNKLCVICGKEYTPLSSLVKVCSPVCFNKMEQKKKKEKELREKEKRKAKKFAREVSVPILAKKADKLWSEAVRQIGYCEYCGETKFLNAHHIFGRSNRSTRWDINNGICLCPKHHTFSNEFSAHRTPSDFTYWLEQKKGRDFMERLSELAHEVQEVNKEFLQETIQKLKERF